MPLIVTLKVRPPLVIPPAPDEQCQDSITVRPATLQPAESPLVMDTEASPGNVIKQPGDEAETEPQTQATEPAPIPHVLAPIVLRYIRDICRKWDVKNLKEFFTIPQGDPRYHDYLPASIRPTIITREFLQKLCYISEHCDCEEARLRIASTSMNQAEQFHGYVRPVVLDWVIASLQTDKGLVNPGRQAKMPTAKEKMQKKRQDKQKQKEKEQAGQSTDHPAPNSAVASHSTSQPAETDQIICLSDTNMDSNSPPPGPATANADLMPATARSEPTQSMPSEPLPMMNRNANQQPQGQIPPNQQPQGHIPLGCMPPGYPPGYTPPGYIAFNGSFCPGAPRTQPPNGPPAPAFAHRPLPYTQPYPSGNAPFAPMSVAPMRGQVRTAQGESSELNAIEEEKAHLIACVNFREERIRILFLYSERVDASPPPTPQEKLEAAYEMAKSLEKLAMPPGMKSLITDKADAWILDVIKPSLERVKRVFENPDGGEGNPFEESVPPFKGIKTERMAQNCEINPMLERIRKLERMAQVAGRQ